MKQVLIVEDESLVALELSEFLSAHGFETVGICGSGGTAVELATTLRPDIVLMDIRLKGAADGISAAKTIYGIYRPALIFLTAFSDDAHIEHAMALQPAGYLIKPVNQRELYALLKLIENRSATPFRGDIVFDTAYSFDRSSERLIKAGKTVHLTVFEHKLLRLLIDYHPHLLSHYDIELALWPDTPPNDSTRRSLVRRLRAKLDNRFIVSVPGEGYRIEFQTM